MAGLMAAFQDFWRENADMNQVPFEYNEAYPHIVLQAFLQRVINGGGRIVREMALGGHPVKRQDDPSCPLLTRRSRSLPAVIEKRRGHTDSLE